MHISRHTYIKIIALIPLILFSSSECFHRKRSSTELRHRGIAQVVSGSIIGAISAGAAIISGLFAYSSSLVFSGSIAALFVTPLIILLPVAVLAAVIAIPLIIYGVKNLKKAKRRALQEQQETLTHIAATS